MTDSSQKPNTIFISPAEANKAYNELGVSSSDTLEVIKQKYRKLLMQYHPDKYKGSENATKKTQDITEAFRLIKDIKEGKITIDEPSQPRSGASRGTRSPFDDRFDDIFGSPGAFGGRRTGNFGGNRSPFDDIFGGSSASRPRPRPSEGISSYQKKELIKLGFKEVDLNKLPQARLKLLGDRLFDIRRAIELGFLPSQLISLNIGRLNKIVSYYFFVEQLMKKGFTSEQFITLDDKKLDKILVDAYFIEQLINKGFTSKQFVKLECKKLNKIILNVFKVSQLIDKGFTCEQFINLEFKKLDKIISNEFEVSRLIDKGFTCEQLINLEFNRLDKILLLDNMLNVRILISDGMTPSEIIGLSEYDFDLAITTGRYNKPKPVPAATPMEPPLFMSSSSSSSSSFKPSKTESPVDAPIPNISLRYGIFKSALFGISVSLVVLVGFAAVGLIAAYAGIAATLFIGAVQWRQQYKYNALREYHNKDGAKLENLPQTEKQGFDSGYHSSRSYFTYFGSMLDKNAYSRAYYAGMGAAETKNDAIHKKMKCTR